MNTSMCCLLSLPLKLIRLSSGGDELGELEETGLSLRVDDPFTFGRQGSRSSARDRAIFYGAGIPISQRGAFHLPLHE